MKPSRPFNETSKQLLADPETARMYLEECLADGNQELFKLALKHVAEARLGGMSALSRATELNREALYRSLSEEGNPSFETLNKVLGAIGFRLSVAQAQTPFAGNP